MRRLPQHTTVFMGLAAVALAATLYAAADTFEQGGQPTAEAARASATDLSTAFRTATREVLPAVVMIESRPAATEAQASYEPKSGKSPQGSGSPERNPLEDKLRGIPFGKQPAATGPREKQQRRPQRERSMGSGVIYDVSGLVLTNHHVVEGHAELSVRLADGREFPAAEVWSDAKTDIAVIRIEGATDLVAARLGNSDDMEIGDWVLALGQPFGLESTVTAGIISGKHRGIGITEREDFLQTDAAINPGNSGGPLINLAGEVIGINTAISSRTGGNDGIGFAVPANLAKWVANQLTTHDTVERAYLGVVIQGMTAELAAQFQVEPREGVLVTEVLPGSPAANAGLQPGDVVVAYKGQTVDTPAHLQLQVERSDVDRPVALAIVRNGSRVALTLTPRAQPSEQPVIAGRSRSVDGTSSKTNVLAPWGLDVEPLDAEIAKRLGLETSDGVLVTNVEAGSSADRAGLESGLVIVQVNRSVVRSVEDVALALRASESQDGVLLLIKHHGRSRFILLRR